MKTEFHVYDTNRLKVPSSRFKVENSSESKVQSDWPRAIGHPVKE
jgi:hypothetical protein